MVIIPTNRAFLLSLDPLAEHGRAVAGEFSTPPCAHEEKARGCAGRSPPWEIGFRRSARLARQIDATPPLGSNRGLNPNETGQPTQSVG